jgi:hypothetical protein
MPDIRDRFARNTGPVVEPPGKQIAGTHGRRPLSPVNLYQNDSAGFICPTLAAAGSGRFHSKPPTTET